MKRIALGIGLLILMLAVGVGITAAFSALHRPLADRLEQAQAAAVEGDWETAAALARDAGRTWQKYRPFTAAVADHAAIEQMDGLFARLMPLAQLQCAEEFAADCAELARLATAMADSQSLIWWNLL